jgi:hypothetical protein
VIAHGDKALSGSSPICAAACDRIHSMRSRAGTHHFTLQLRRRLGSCQKSSFSRGGRPDPAPRRERSRPVPVTIGEQTAGRAPLSVALDNQPPQPDARNPQSMLDQIRRRSRPVSTSFSARPRSSATRSSRSARATAPPADRRARRPPDVARARRRHPERPRARTPPAPRPLRHRSRLRRPPAQPPPPSPRRARRRGRPRQLCSRRCRAVRR